MATYYEVIIKSEEDVARAFIEGFMLGKGIRRGVAFGKDQPFDLRHVKEFVKYHGDVVHVVVESKVWPSLRSALSRAERADISIVESHKIRRAYFHFKFQTANRKVAGRIKRMISRLPAGVRVLDYAPKEIVDPKARGSEGYAPVHEYVFKGRGVIEGDPEGVYRRHQKMADDEFIKVENVVLHRGE